MGMLSLKSRLSRLGLRALAAGGFVALLFTTAMSSGANTPRPGSKPLLEGSDVPLQVRSILRRACQDCHSPNTVWPWYAKIPPVSWQIQDDVARGRALLDFSKWNDYSEEERRGVKVAIEGVTEAGLMPPPKYLWLHRDARLSPADLEALRAWVPADPAPPQRVSASPCSRITGSRSSRRSMHARRP